MTPRERADAYLEDLGEMAGRIQALERQAQADMEAVKAKWAAVLEPLKEEFKAVERDLLALLKRETAAVFNGADKVSLRHGVLIHGKEFKVKIPRGALQKVEEMGWMEAVRISKSLDRSVVERWPVERLEMIGATRKLVEKFAYELKARSMESRPGRDWRESKESQTWNRT